jgi:hypothetical protein
MVQPDGGRLLHIANDQELPFLSVAHKPLQSYLTFVSKLQ